MAEFHILPSQLKGSLSIPPSKSHTLRAILFAALANGASRIDNFLPSPDTAAMVHAVQLLGARVKNHSTHLEIHGIAGRFSAAEDVIQCGNSGLVLRLIGALAGLIPHYTILTGDASIRHNRPVRPLLDALTQLGAHAISTRGDGFAPIAIKGPLTKRSATLDGQDSQPVSGLLIASAFAPHPIELHVTNPGEKPWVDLTLHWLRKLNIPCECHNHTHYSLQGNGAPHAFTYSVPGDFSTAAFPLVAALLTHSELTLTNLDLDDPQGDKAIIPLLQQMGARIQIDQTHIQILKSDQLRGLRIDINHCVDALPILAVLATAATTPTEIVGAAIARKKESDRIATITQELRKMGARIEEREDGLLIHPSDLRGAALETHHDHRLVMALSIAALRASGPSLIHNVEAAHKSYPTFYEDFRALGANIDLIVQ